tara:strand:- start:725 stop:1309 length:585 start_codon:yes stop_codon:yes gene_type:complete
MENIKAIAVYCGSKPGASPIYAAAARELGRQMTEHNIRLVFGGGRIGLMGEVADQVLTNGGQVTGVIPHFLNDLEVAHNDVTELITVESMHERKHVMFSRSDAFVILPGGLGTLDECMEIITWKQLQVHSRPIIILDVEGYWKSLRVLFQDIVDGGFAHPKALEMFSIVENVDDVFTAIAAAPEPDPVVLESHL